MSGSKLEVVWDQPLQGRFHSSMDATRKILFSVDRTISLNLQFCGANEYLDRKNVMRYHQLQLCGRCSMTWTYTSLKLGFIVACMWSHEVVKALS